MTGGSLAATKEVGPFDVQVFTVNGDTDAERLVRTYKIEVRAAHCVPAGQQPGEAPVSFIFLRPKGYPSYSYSVFSNQVK
ncbi:MAG TPA: hypothetical protein VFS10_01535 [Pyrinomonadaceae bacterium]|nr:hypothetical protein [Pyrinomonadaceae bacterium]